MSENEGWVCPVCRTVYAPTVKVCKKCTKTEQTKQSQQLLTE